LQHLLHLLLIRDKMQQLLQIEGIMELKWLMFCPVLPATPSSPRVTVWRRMRSAGAASLDNGLWLLPNSASAVDFIREMQTYVGDQGGSSKTFYSDAFDEATQREILNRFQQDRAAEYGELQEQCADFLKEIEKETQRQNFSFAEYEENEEDLNKLEAWLAKIQRRDFLGSDQANATAAKLEQCRTALQQFAAEIFAREETKSTASEN